MLKTSEDFIGIYTRPDSIEALRVAHEAYMFISSQRIEARIDVSIKPYFKTLFGGTYLTYDIRFHIPRKIVVVGGDGTLLRLYSLIGERGDPIIHPIKAGRRGFLFELDSYTGIRRIKDFIEDRYRVEKLLRLRVTLFSGNEDSTVSRCSALNEAAIVAPGSKTVVVEIWSDGEPLYENLEGDGVIVATPTGSTAYSYSAGGPVLDRELEAFVITPLNPIYCARPVVVPASKHVSIRVTKTRRAPLLIIDGQKCARLNTGSGIVVEKSPVYARIARYGKPRRIMPV